MVFRGEHFVDVKAQMKQGEGGGNVQIPCFQSQARGRDSGSEGVAVRMKLAHVEAPLFWNYHKLFRRKSGVAG